MAAPPGGSVPVRFEFRLAPAATHATCLAGEGVPGLDLRTWRRVGRDWLPGPALGAVDHPQLLVMDDGRILVYDSRAADPALWLYEPDGARIRLTDSIPNGLRIFRAPRPDRIGLALVPDGAHTEIRRIELTPPGLTERLARVPGVLATGLPLESSGMVLAMEQSAVANGATRVLAVDLRDGSWTTLLDVHDRSHDGVLLTDPATGLAIFGTDASGARKLGWAVVGRGGLRFPAALNPGGEPYRPLAVAPDGRKLLLERQIGVRSALSVYRLDDDSSTELPVPPGRALPPVRWTEDALTTVWSTPDAPARLITVAPPDDPEFRLPESGGESPVRVESFAGPAGPIEAIVHGAADWRRAERIVLAVHGGPLSAWRLQHTPLLHRLAGAGLVVVAPNQRGSTGYGDRHTRAIQGAWGGPDLADILHIARELHAARSASGLPRLRLYGESYGAFLALLAVADEPNLWDRCAVLAPFLSARRLYDDATPGIRDLIDRLDGRSAPADVLPRCHRIDAELFIAHGARDAMVPVGQSRLLVDRLRSLGKPVRYLELPTGTHELTTDPHGVVADAVTGFLAGGR
ncbi:alpha/beta hydrolase family protein [Nocardia arthritidis]|uniref:Alpha/beta fold hydrolase n=1 Tax=Nocardia arthritidis TaxID=228602 RepID=A0A6G9YPM6_9NOCA|nr:alpha/beta fold hydrolase [Nocardia arthritidis]QIS14976.1 alpha/beta fold hydrolase [Nocardia arthritidis]